MYRFVPNANFFLLLSVIDSICALLHENRAFVSLLVMALPAASLKKENLLIAKMRIRTRDLIELSMKR